MKARKSATLCNQITFFSNERGAEAEWSKALWTCACDRENKRKQKMFQVLCPRPRNLKKFSNKSRPDFSQENRTWRRNAAMTGSVDSNEMNLDNSSSDNWRPRGSKKDSVALEFMKSWQATLRGVECSNQGWIRHDLGSEAWAKKLGSP